MKAKNLFYLFAVAALFAFAVIAGCKKPQVPTNPISLSFQQTYQNRDFSLKFDSVLNDSRCPSDVICCWEGNAEVRLIYVDRYFTERRIILDTHIPDNRFRNDTTIGNVNIKLVELSPYPVSTKIIEQEDYVAKILLTIID